MAPLALATSVTRVSVGVRSSIRAVTLEMGAASTTRSAPRTSFTVEARWMAPTSDRFFENFGTVHAEDVPTRVAGREADGTPDQADADDPERAGHASAAMTRSFSSESPTVTRLQPG